MNQLVNNIDRLHTTELGIMRIKRNLEIDTYDVVEYCKKLILDKRAAISRKGKNWYISISGCIITVNAHSYTIITAHTDVK